MDSSDDDSDEGQKPMMSGSLSKLDSSDSDNNRSPAVDAANASSHSNKKQSSYLETDSEQEAPDSKTKQIKTVKMEFDHSDSNKESISKKKSTKSSISDTDSDLEE